MADPNEQGNGPGERPDEDTQAILNRRRFLIASALAGAGLGAAATGCDRDAQPDICLKVAPRPRLTPKPPAKPGTADRPEPKPATAVEPRPCLEPVPPDRGHKPGTRPEVCLSVEIPPAPKPGPKVCLKLAPRKPEPKPCLTVPPRPTPKPGPRPCLSRPPRPTPKPEPRPCLSRPLPKPSTRKPRPGPCLSPRRR